MDGDWPAGTGEVLARLATGATRAAHAAVPRRMALTTYRGYSVVDYPPSVSGDDLAGRRGAMRTYAAYAR